MTRWTVYIGHDRREHVAYEVCRASIERRCSDAARIVRLDDDSVRHAGIYARGWKTKNGQRIDVGDGRPFSTDFAFSRFLVPALNLYQGWALFCDCDFLFTADLAGLFRLADDRYAIMCVKHEHDPVETSKMDGVSQGRYRRKNWSSLVLWNCEHAANRTVTLDCVNKMPGRWLHAFEWLKDEHIGDLPRSWNWLAGVDPEPPELPCGIHYTLGGPWFADYQNVPYADLWRAERDSRRTGERPLPSERDRSLRAA